MKFVVFFLALSSLAIGDVYSMRSEARMRQKRKELARVSQHRFPTDNQAQVSYYKDEMYQHLNDERALSPADVAADGRTADQDEMKADIRHEETSDDPMVSYLSRRRRWDGHFVANMTCEICELVIESLQEMIREEKTREEIIEEAIKICIKLRIEDERICKMIVPLFQEEGIYVVANLPLAPSDACGLLLRRACAKPYFPGSVWNVTFPDIPKPEPKPPTPPKPKAPTVRFLQLTDIHIDFMYKEGSNPDCGEPLCCRANDNLTATPAKDRHTAGKFGQLDHCDAPHILVENLFRHLSTIKDQFDYVIFTGDIPAHDVWNQSKTDQLEHLVTLDRLFNKYLPDKPWYACVGNHESSPISSCGSYSFSPFSGFRIISVNDNYCNNLNWWLLLNTTDPCDLLQWLIGELQSAEVKGEKVHLLMHIPPGNTDCLKRWSHNFYSVINRYENTIVNQFYGHTHHDSFLMFYDEESLQRPVNHAYISSSATPFSFNNPVYRIYTMDGNYPNSSWAVLDYDQFYFNLTEANLHNNPNWIFEYSPKAAYNMKGLYAADWEDLLQRMEKDDNLFQLFYQHNQNLNQREPCVEVCKTEFLCTVKEGRSYDHDMCDIHH